MAPYGPACWWYSCSERAGSSCSPLHPCIRSFRAWPCWRVSSSALGPLPPMSRTPERGRTCTWTGAAQRAAWRASSSLSKSGRELPPTPEASHQQTNHRHLDQRFARLDFPLVILAHAAVARKPSEGPFHYPPLTKITLGSWGRWFDCDLQPHRLQALHQPALHPLPIPLIEIAPSQVQVVLASHEEMIHNHEQRVGDG